jgi:D-arabinose 5-phosphate isomerase GutQ
MIDNTLVRNSGAVYRAVLSVETWVRARAEIRIVGYGRARLAVAIPGNRLAHAGANVSTLGDITPLASTSRGGGLIAASSSGTTSHVLEILTSCRRQAPHIAIVGLAAEDATHFASLCDVFIGISAPTVSLRPSLLYFSDAVEYAISEVMDAVVAAAVDRAGVTEQDLRHGHEDLGGTGPYTVQAGEPS